MMETECNPALGAPGGILRLSAHPELFSMAAEWFHSKWKVPVSAYLSSMEESLSAAGGVPEWYVILKEDGSVAAGLGIIENDFHRRPDLRPNICAVFVEPEYRERGLARLLLDTACADLTKAGVPTAYLITGHTDFYERCGWTFYGVIEEDDGSPIRMYRHSAKL